MQLPLPSINFGRYTLTPGNAVELNSGDFIRILEIQNRLRIRTSDDEVLSSDIILTGKLFRRALKLEYMNNKRNEVALIEEDAQASLDEVLCTRELIVTNASFPSFRDEECIVCRWVWNISPNSKVGGTVRRITEAEADPQYRCGSYVLLNAWRQEKLEKHMKEIERKRRDQEKETKRRKQVRRNLQCGGGLLEDPFFANQRLDTAITCEGYRRRNPSTISCEATSPVTNAVGSKDNITSTSARYSARSPEAFVTPKRSSIQLTDEGYYTATKPHGRTNLECLTPPPPPPPPSTPSRSERSHGNAFSDGIPENIVSLEISDEDDEEIPSFKLHRQDIFPQSVKGVEAPPYLKPIQYVWNSPVASSSERNGIPAKSPRSPKVLRRTPEYTFGDAFCGAGGTSMGAEMAHFRVTWGVDWDKSAIDTYRTNFPGVRAYHCPIDEFLSNNPDSVLVDVLHLSPPCQPYSTAHTVPGKNDDTNSAALFAIHKALDNCRPRVATVEQTFGILNAQHKNFFVGLLSQFVDMGFSVRYKVLKGVEYGLPQHRKRLFVIAAW